MVVVVVVVVVAAACLGCACGGAEHDDDDRSDSTPLTTFDFIICIYVLMVDLLGGVFHPPLSSPRVPSPNSDFLSCLCIIFWRDFWKARVCTTVVCRPTHASRAKFSAGALVAPPLAFGPWIAGAGVSCCVPESYLTERQPST